MANSYSAAERLFNAFLKQSQEPKRTSFVECNPLRIFKDVVLDGNFDLEQIARELQMQDEVKSNDNIVIVCGSRHGTNTKARELVFDTLDKLHAEKPITLVKHGAAKGYDSWAGEWAKERKINCTEYIADWKMYGDSAGPIRNQMMARSGANKCIAFPGGNGTESMKSWARKFHIPVVEITFPEVINKE